MKLPINYNNAHWTVRQKARKEYIKIQQGNCYFCKSSLYGPPHDEILQKHIDKQLFPENFFAWPIHLHHNHKTGETIGAVHNYCNAVMWQYYKE